MIGVATGIRDRAHRVTFTNPGSGPAVPDGDGGYVPPASQALDPPTVSAKITTATTADLESLSSGSVLAKATHLCFMPFHPHVSTLTRATWTDAAGRAHSASVTGVIDPDQLGRELVVGLVEVVE